MEVIKDLFSLDGTHCPIKLNREIVYCVEFGAVCYSGYVRRNQNARKWEL